ncbi:uncharacterized protein [Spinacia oleracea]|uniref:Reverse transcriptase domain-containing protein n=1 Tax=Spinacia oleracea TaxID=3562 RepID=A0ABM3QLS5_SPIOL|nr:uncharacterized protein LOC130460788 [Spinacia oleracea]
MTGEAEVGYSKGAEEEEEEEGVVVEAYIIPYKKDNDVTTYFQKLKDLKDQLSKIGQFGCGFSGGCGFRMSFQSDGVFERGWVDFQDGGSFSCFFGWLGVGLKVVDSPHFCGGAMNARPVVKRKTPSELRVSFSPLLWGRKGVGILIDREYIDDVVDVSRKSDRIMSIKLVIGDEVVTIVSAYAPQAGLDASTRQEFWEDLEEVVQRVPRSEKLIIGGDLNGHVGSSRDEFESIHGGFGYGERNEAGNAILDFALAYDLGIMNTWFEKRDSHLVTYRSGDNTSQIDFFLVRNALRQCYTNCKVIPGESTATQHKLVVLYFRGRSYIRRERPLVEPRIKWWKLQGEQQLKFVEKVASEGICAGDMDLDIDSLWTRMEHTIKGVEKEVLGEFKGIMPPSKDTSWWNEVVQQAIKSKRECYKELGKCRSDEKYEKYKEAKREAKKAVREARAKVNQDLYARLYTKEGEKDIYRLARMRDRKTRDIGRIKCVKDVDQKVLVGDKEIKDRWRFYFDNLFNGDQRRDIGDINIPRDMVNLDFMRWIQKREVEMALKKMGRKTVVGPDGIPIEVWRCLGERGVVWLTTLFNKIWGSNKMPLEWRKSTIIPLYKNKGDVQDCANYRGISHTMKLWERIIEQRLRRTVKSSVNQFGFMHGRSAMEAINLIRRIKHKLFVIEIIVVSRTMKFDELINVGIFSIGTTLQFLVVLCYSVAKEYNFVIVDIILSTILAAEIGGGCLAVVGCIPEKQMHEYRGRGEGKGKGKRGADL